MHVLITRWRQTFSLPSSDQLIQLGNLWFARELWWHRSIMHVKVKINIVVCCQFDMHFSPHFEIFWQSGHGSKSYRAPSAHFKGFTASDSGSTAKCRVPACILRPDYVTVEWPLTSEVSSIKKALVMQQKGNPSFVKCILSVCYNASKLQLAPLVVMNTMTLLCHLCHLVWRFMLIWYSSDPALTAH